MSTSPNLTLQVQDSHFYFPAIPGLTLLDSALAAGINFPFGCRAGECGACKCQILSGTADEFEHDPLALGRRERAEGWRLACCLTPRNDMSLRVVLLDAVGHCELTCEVTHIEHVTDTVVIVKAIPRDNRHMQFRAGQYVQVRFPNGAVRPYSLANQPTAPLLEWHIRQVPGGAASSYAYEQLTRGELLTITGPFGSAVYDERHEGPLLAVAAGTGLAPLKSIISTALACPLERDVLLFFGMRHQQDFYDLAFFQALDQQHPRFSFIPVVTGGNTQPRPYRTLTEAVLNRSRLDLTNVRMHVAGAPSLIEEATRLSHLLRIPPENCRYDGFSHAPVPVGSIPRAQAGGA